MSESIFNKEDLQQIEARGMRLADVMSQIELFGKGFPYMKLKRACTIGDGIGVLEKEDLERYAETFTQAALSSRAMKFVPASGAASRMFKLLLAFNSRHGQTSEAQIRAGIEKNDPDCRSFLQFIDGLRKFAFYEDLRSAMSRDGIDIESHISNGQYKSILEYMLTAKGLNLAGLPKGLIKFHKYPGHERTPFEEHLVEAVAYTQDRKKVARVHFTVSPEHEASVKDHVAKIRRRYEESGAKLEVSFSAQEPVTDTIAVDLDNKPFRDSNGRLVFRPGGHGALLKNLNDLQGDLVFIKNIDNVVPDRLKPQTYLYKKALGGYLIELQDELFSHLERLAGGDEGDRLIKAVFEFARHKLSLVPPGYVEQGSTKDKANFISTKLNRPLRVCGMVKNEGEPGGGPFWVEQADRTISLQIVESSQVDMKSGQQRAMWESATHFNPVDMVCGVRDRLGSPFDLMHFTDPDTGFISIKSKDGRDLKALELPGLWNGAMGNWNTVFVEVPIGTFNPVKTLLDLLRKEHLPI